MFFFSRFEYHLFDILHPSPTRLLTLPRIFRVTPKEQKTKTVYNVLERTRLCEKAGLRGEVGVTFPGKGSINVEKEYTITLANFAN
jgi:hypothetical protein